MTVSKKTMIMAGAGIGAVVLLAGAGAVVAKGFYGHGMGGPLSGAPMNAIIDQIDSNADGALSAEEIQAFRSARFAAMDADGDGELTPKEMSDGMQAMVFSIADANGDGMISQDEFREIAQGRFQKMQRKFHKLDDDGNGRVSAEELASMTDRMMSWIDDNDDGTLDASELEGMHGRHHR